jgi:hypothetical protein
MMRYSCLLLGLPLMSAISMSGQEEVLTNQRVDLALGSAFMRFGIASSVTQCNIRNVQDSWLHLFHCLLRVAPGPSRWLSGF